MSHVLNARLEPQPSLLWRATCATARGAWSLATWGPKKIYHAFRPEPSIDEPVEDLYDYSQAIAQPSAQIQSPITSSYQGPSQSRSSFSQPQQLVEVEDEEDEESEGNEEELDEDEFDEGDEIEEDEEDIDLEEEEVEEADEAEPEEEQPQKPQRKSRRIKQEAVPVIAKPTEPKHLNRAFPTFMRDPQIIADTFFIVANREKGRMTKRIVGIEPGLNETVNVAISTPKVSEGIGVVITDTGTSLIWNRKANGQEIERLRVQLQKIYLAITAIHSLQGNLGYKVETISEHENTVAIEAQKQGKWITIFLNASNGDILTDFGNFEGMECFEEARALLDSFEEKGVDIKPHGAIPKDASGVPLFDMIKGDITIQYSSDEDRRHVLEAFRRSGIASTIKFDSRCG